MPLFDFKCKKCSHIVLDVYIKARELDSTKIICPRCSAETRKMLPVFIMHSFKEQFLEHLQHGDVPYVRSKQDVTDAVNRFNDSELASKQGKIAVY